MSSFYYSLFSLEVKTNNEQTKINEKQTQQMGETQEDTDEN